MSILDRVKQLNDTPVSYKRLNKYEILGELRFYASIYKNICSYSICDCFITLSDNKNSPYYIEPVYKNEKGKIHRRIVKAFSKCIDERFNIKISKEDKTFLMEMLGNYCRYNGFDRTGEGTLTYKHLSGGEMFNIGEYGDDESCFAGSISAVQKILVDERNSFGVLLLDYLGKKARCLTHYDERLDMMILFNVYSEDNDITLRDFASMLQGTLDIVESKKITFKNKYRGVEDKGWVRRTVMFVNGETGIALSDEKYYSDMYTLGIDVREYLDADLVCKDCKSWKTDVFDIKRVYIRDLSKKDDVFEGLHYFYELMDDDGAVSNLLCLHCFREYVSEFRR